MPENPIDALSLASVRVAALESASERGCGHAEVRVERIRTQVIALRDGVVEGAADDTEVGVGVRVVREGSMGFAATVDTEPDAVRDLVGKATNAAQLTASGRDRLVELADEPGYGEVAWQAPYAIDPTEVPFADKVELLSSWSERLRVNKVVSHVTARLMLVTEDKYFADLSGTISTQRRVRVHPSFEVLGLKADGTGFESARSVAPPVGRGYEYLSGQGWDFEAELDQLPDLLEEKLVAPSVEPGRYDLVIDPTNLWLTIHESVGHATELDRAFGYEAAYAGTSFATFDKLNKLQYGSPLMRVTGDRTVEYGLASIGYDDEGVKAQTFDIVNEGVLVGYQLDRKIAHEAGFGRSNGCAFGCSPLMTPIQRMANVSLQPNPTSDTTTQDLISGVDRGIYVIGDKSWSIDMQRYNFQFTGQRFYLIEHGRLSHQLRDVVYQATTTEFWGSLDGLGGPSTYLLCGAMNCGKGQPSQTAPVSHGCPSALFRNVNVLNVREESGR